MSCDNYPSKKDVEDFALNAKVINEFTTATGELTPSAASDGKQKITLAEIWRQANEKSVTEAFLYDHTWRPWVSDEESVKGALYLYDVGMGKSVILKANNGGVVLGDNPTHSEFDVVSGELVFDNVTAAKNSKIPVGCTVVTKGYYTANDGGGASYVASHGVTADEYGDHSTAIGSVLVMNATGAVGAKQYGLGTDDDSEPWQALLKNDRINSVHFSSGVYSFLKASVCKRSISVTSDPDAVIDCSSDAFAGNFWTEFSGDLERIEDVAVNISRGDQNITFTAPPSLSAGDVFIVYDSRLSSYSAFREYYFAGEFLEVASVDGNNALLRLGARDNYESANIAAYKVLSISPRVSVNIRGKVSVGLVKFSLCRNAVASNITATHSGNSCIALDRCYSCTVTNIDLTNSGDGGDDYGISIGNSQSIRVSSGRSYGRRHAIAIGGANLVGSVPCRDVIIDNMSISNDVSSGVFSADFHGNCEDCKYENCNINGGATWQGKNNGYVRCTISAMDIGCAIYSAEIKGGRFYAHDCNIYSYTDPAASTRGVIDVGGNTVSVSEKTVEDCTFEVINCNINGVNFGDNTAISAIRNRGSSKKINVYFDGIRITADKYNAVLSMRNYEGGIADSDYIVIDNVISNISGKHLILHHASSYAEFKHRLQSQSGKQSVSTTAGAGTVTGSEVTFNWIYPKNPVIQISRNDQGYAGNRVGIAYANSVSTSKFSPYLSTDDATGFAASVSIDLDWHAGIKEI